MSLPPQHPVGSGSAAAAAASSAAAGGAGVAAASDLPISFPAWDAPPQASYGWFVDVPPPRGPYFWPTVPEQYKLRSQTATRKDEKSSGIASSSTPVPAGEVSNESLFPYAPQLAWGWFCAGPPPQPPFFWPALPEGYVLVRADEVSVSHAAQTAQTAAAASVAAAAPQRQVSQVTANPLAASSTLPTPHAITTQPMPLTMPMALGLSMPPMPMGSPPMSFAPFLNAATNAPLASATANALANTLPAQTAAAPTTTAVTTTTPTPVATTTSPTAPAPAPAVAPAVPEVAAAPPEPTTRAKRARTRK